jgi:hypothetical protein
MNVAKLTLTVMGILGILLGLTPVARAGGAPAGLECCVKVPANLGGTIPMKATVAVYYDAHDPLNTIADATIRLERSGAQRFYRIRLTGVNMFDVSDEDRFCMLLNPCAWETNPSNRAAVITVVNAILDEFFGLPSVPGTGEPAGELLISNKSISDTDPDPDARQIPGIADRFMSIADVSVYVSEF